ncbi:unnamed protein product [Lampetra planeri]
MKSYGREAGRGRQWPKETAKDQQQHQKQATREMEKQEKKTRKETKKQKNKTRKEREKEQMNSALTVTSLCMHEQDNRERKAKLEQLGACGVTKQDLNTKREKARNRRRIEATALKLWRNNEMEKEQISEKKYYLQRRRKEAAHLRLRREKKAAKKKRRQEMEGEEVSRGSIMMRMSLWWCKLRSRWEGNAVSVTAENKEAEQDSQAMKALQETPGKFGALTQDMKVQRAMARNRRRIEAARIRRWRIKQLPKEQKEEKASRLKTGEKVGACLRLRLEKKAAMKKRHQEKEEVASGSRTYTDSRTGTCSCASKRRRIGDLMVEMKSHEEAGRGRQWSKETAKDQQQQQKKQATREIEKQKKKTRKERVKQKKKTRKEREKDQMKNALTLTSVFLYKKDNREKKAKLERLGTCRVTTQDLNTTREKARNRRRIEATALKRWRINEIEKEKNSEKEYYLQMRGKEAAQLRLRREKKAAKEKRRQEMEGEEVSRGSIMMRMSLWWCKLRSRWEGSAVSLTAENKEAEQDSQAMKALQETPGKCGALTQDMKVQRAKERNRRRIEAARIRRWRIKQLPKEQQEEKASRLKTGKKVDARLRLRLEKKAAMKKRHQEKEEVASGSLPFRIKSNSREEAMKSH